MSGFKTLTIKKLVYDDLLKFKAPSESFSELFERFMEKEKSKKPDIMEFAGILSEEKGEEIKKMARAYREKGNKDAEERQKYLERKWQE